MLLRNDCDEWFREERLYLQAGCVAAIAQEACVELAFEKLLHDCGGERLVQLQVHLRVKSAITSEHGRQRGQHRGPDESYSQEALFATADAACLFHVLLHVAESSPGSRQKHFSGAGKFYGTRRPDEEWIAEDPFEVACLL